MKSGLLNSFCVFLTILIPLLVINAQPFTSLSETGTERAIAITIDDLPLNSRVNNPELHKRITENMLGSLADFEVSAVGFVNEGKLYENDKLVQSRMDLLSMWLNAGMELGNHTYSHSNYHDTDIESFGKDILKGELITNRLLREQGYTVRYFRHPYLRVGNSKEKKIQLEKFLTRNGYITAPVTIDNSEWIFARAYERALAEEDSMMIEKIGKEYVSYMEKKVAYYEQQSQDLFGREIKQVLLIHANVLNSEYLDELLAMLENRDYTFITLAEALRDEAYRSKDTYTGPAGISWIHRWAISKGKKGDFFAGEPLVADFVMSYAGLDSE